MPRVYRALNKVSYSLTPSGDMTHELNTFLVCIVLLYVSLIYSLLKVSVLFLSRLTPYTHILWKQRREDELARRSMRQNMRKYT